MNSPEYFRLEELLNSQTARDNKIQNSPSWEIVENLYNLAVNILDPLRREMGCAITVTSGFRNLKINTIVKGSKTSQHMRGQAADIVCKDNRKLFDTAKKMIEEGRITVGQLIWEYGTSKAPDWVHISLPTETLHNQIKYIGVK